MSRWVLEYERLPSLRTADGEPDRGQAPPSDARSQRVAREAAARLLGSSEFLTVLEYGERGSRGVEAVDHDTIFDEFHLQRVCEITLSHDVEALPRLQRVLASPRLQHYDAWNA